jgi:glycosyltransferase involved in cell wall biosynthesis
LNQDYPNLEIIVIDGGSTDNSIEVIKRYQDRLAYWVCEPDNGQSHAINKGFRRARGELVAWLNSDDVYFPNAVSTAVQRFQEYPDLSLFYGNCVFINERGGFIRYFTEVESWNKGRLLNYGDFIMQPTTFFPKAKLEQVGLLDESLHYGMDWDLWCKLSNLGGVHYERRVIAANREYGATKTSSGSWRRLRELFRIQQRHKTDVWPHAFFGYCSTEFHRKANSASVALTRLFWECSAYAVAALSPSAIMQNKKLYPHTFLYGLRRHSSEVPDGEATIFLPLVSRFSSVNLSLRTAANRMIKIDSPDKTQELTSDGRDFFLLLPVGHETRKQGFWSARISVRDDKGKHVGGEILSVNWTDT